MCSNWDSSKCGQCKATNTNAATFTDTDAARATAKLTDTFTNTLTVAAASMCAWLEYLSICLAVSVSQYLQRLMYL